jgi:hypothetical protein
MMYSGAIIGESSPGRDRIVPAVDSPREEYGCSFDVVLSAGKRRNRKDLILRGLCFQRQGIRKNTPSPGRAFGPYPAAVVLDDLARYGKAKPRALCYVGELIA